MKEFTVQLEEDPIRFTPDGKIAVIDAIQALCGPDSVDAYWETLILEYPEIKDLCDYHHFPGSRKTPVTDSRGWQKMEIILFDRLVTDHVK